MRAMMLLAVSAAILMTGCDYDFSSGWSIDTGNPYGDDMYQDQEWPEDPGCGQPDTTTPLPTFPALTASIWARDQFVVVGNKILRSVDGESFTVTSFNSNDRYDYLLTDIAWSSRGFVAVGRPNRIYTSQDGVTWDRMRVDAADITQLEHVACSENGCVAIGGSWYTSYLLYSADGVEWCSIKWFPYTYLRDVIWDGERYMITADSLGHDLPQSAGIVLTSVDGRGWRSHLTGQSHGFDCLRRVDNQYLAVGQVLSTSTHNVMTSSDGLTWILVASLGNSPQSITTDGTTIIAAYYQGGIARISSDGTVTEESFTKQRIRDVYFAHGMFVAAAVGLIATSVDGVTWTTKWQWEGV